MVTIFLKDIDFDKDLDDLKVMDIKTDIKSIANSYITIAMDDKNFKVLKHRFLPVVVGHIYHKSLLHNILRKA